MNYGSAQKIGFGGVFIGFVMCIAGAISPFWQTGEMNANNVIRLVSSISIPFLGSASVIKYNTGIWWWCLEFLGEKQCYNYKDSVFDSKKMWGCRIGSVLCIILSFSCVLTGLCRSCCGGSGKTIGHGTTVFVAGAAGIVTVALFASAASDNAGFTEQFLKLEYGWAFIMFSVGTGIIVITSFMLCFTKPEDQVQTSSIGVPAIVVVNSSQQSQSLGGFQQPNPYLVNGWQQQPIPHQYSNRSFSEEPYSKPPGWA